MAKIGARAPGVSEGPSAANRGPAFARESRELEEFKAEEQAAAVAPLAPWELAFWAEKLRPARYDFDEEILRPVLPDGRVIAGLFELVSAFSACALSSGPPARSRPGIPR